MESMGGSDAAVEAQGTSAEAEAPAQDQGSEPPEWAQALNGRMDELMESARGWGQQDEGQPDGEYEEDDAQPDMDWLNDPEIDPEAVQQHLSQTIDQRAQSIAEQMVNERLGPIEQRFQEQELDNLVEQYPDLDKPEVAQAALQAAQQLAQELGMPQMATSPKFIENVYLAGRAREQAGRETPAGDHPMLGLEQDAAAASGQAAPDTADQIVNAGRNSSFWM